MTRRPLSLRRRTVLGTIAAAALLPAGGIGAAATPPRRVGFIHSIAGDEPTVVAQVLAFEAELVGGGWTIGSDLLIDYRFADGTVESASVLAADLLALAPDIVVTVSTPVTMATREIAGPTPIVFYQVPDPVGAGFVATLERPGGTMTGFTSFHGDFIARWMELLLAVAPDTREVTLLYNPEAAATFVDLYFSAAPAVAESAGVTLYALTVEEEAMIPERIALAAGQGRGLIVLPDAFTHSAARRRAIVEAAATNRLPAIYPFPEFVTDGGLMAYSVDMVAQAAQVGEYVDLILRGASPAALPVIPPRSFVLMVNPAAASALGLSFPAELLAEATVVEA